MMTGSYLKKKIINIPVVIAFTTLYTIIIFLNTIDIFYFRFHLQRADADLLYVLRNPFLNGTLTVYLIVFAALIFCMLTARWVSKNLSRISLAAEQTNRFWFTNLLLILLIALFFLSGTKKIIPTSPLTEIDAVQLPATQNSFHSFIYSLYRKNEVTVPDIHYMSTSAQQSLFSIHKKNSNKIEETKNIVLFIMESVPASFFDSSSRYKVTMPFLDSLVNKSTWFSNAFSYAYNSNKGITAILAGIPTITDIPLYHSNYTSIDRTSVGTALAKKNYQSAFFIGDNYDDLGFAKCCKWLGIEKYYCMEDIPGHQQMEKHSLGLHDEYVLNFMQEKLAGMQQPFFAVQYNISTHYPNDIPKGYSNSYPNNHLTRPMKSMQYYNDCLRQFFTTAVKQPWYNNTVFIFCADHWAQPDDDNVAIDPVQSFRIPLFIYEPGKNNRLRISAPVSQLDVLNTVLHFANYQDSIISYGEDLTDSLPDTGRVIYTKINSVVYQAITNEYVLGFNAVEGKALYCYNYKQDPAKKHDLLASHVILPEVSKIILQMKAFLQTTANHYHAIKVQHL